MSELAQTAENASKGRGPHRDSRLGWHADIRKILIIKWSAMGDVALASAAFQDIREAFPGAELHLSTLPPWRRMFDTDPRFTRIVDIDVRKPRGRLWANLAWLRTVIAERYDMVVDLQTTDRSAALLGLMQWVGAGVPVRVGNKSRRPYTHAPVDSPKSLHAFLRLQKTLGAAGIIARAPRPVLFPSAEQVAKANAAKREHGLIPGAFAVFLPGSQADGYLKRWGAERYAALARRLAHTEGLKILVLGGPDETEECEQLTRAADGAVINLCGKTDILELIPLVQGARFIVANDTGTAHVAAAAGVPILSICGPTDPNRVKPAGDTVMTLQADLDCLNCYRKHCSHHSCMKVLPAELVYGELRTRLGDLSAGGAKRCE